MLVLKKSKYGHFYGCETWHCTACPGAHGAHADGTPLGIPASKATREARMRAHAAFDRLWKGPKARMRRHAAYAWLQEAMGMTADAAHIGRFTIAECDEVCRQADRCFETEVDTAGAATGTSDGPWARAAAHPPIIDPERVLAVGEAMLERLKP